MPIYNRLTDRTKVSAVTLNDLFHVVVTGDTTQSPQGSSYYATISDLQTVLSGATVPGLNNEVLTSDGSGGIVSESNLTFDGNLLFVNGTQQIDDSTGSQESLLIRTTSIVNDPYYSINLENSGDDSTTSNRVGVRSSVFGGLARNISYESFLDNCLTGDTYGMFIQNSPSSLSIGEQYGVFANLAGNSGNNQNGYGVKTTVSAQNSRNYGLYTQVENGPINYGIYSQVQGNVGYGNYAGYFYNSSAVNDGNGEVQNGIVIQVDGDVDSLNGYKYGANISVSNNGRYNYGLYIDVLDATTNYAIFTRRGSSVFNNQQDTTSDFLVNGSYPMLFVDSSSDRVGIGTDTPTSLLHVSGDTLIDQGSLTVYDVGNKTNLFSGSSTNDWVRITQAGSGNSFVVEDENNPDSTRFRIDSKGNVFMGNPTYYTNLLNVGGFYQFVHNPTGVTLSTTTGYGDIVTFGTGSLTAGKVYYFSSSGAWIEADASSVSASTYMLAVALGPDPSVYGMLVRGYFRNSSLLTNTGDILYLSTTSGVITRTAPSTVGEVKRIVGYSLDGTNQIIYFNPDNSWVVN